METNEDPIWHRSEFCGTNACVEVAQTDNQILVRDSKNPGNSPLGFSPDAWQAFVAGIKYRPVRPHLEAIASRPNQVAWGSSPGHSSLTLVLQWLALWTNMRSAPRHPDFLDHRPAHRARLALPPENPRVLQIITLAAQRIHVMRENWCRRAQCPAQ
jgi:hypothetical protein